MLSPRTLADTGRLKTSPSVQDQRRHPGWNQVVFLLYLHSGAVAGDGLCAEVGELCALLSEEETSGSSTGQPQASGWAQELPELLCGLYCLFNLSDFCAAFSHVGVHAGTDEETIQSVVHVEWCTDPQGRDIPALRSRIF